MTCLQGVPDTCPAFLGALCSQDLDDSRIQCEDMDEDLLSDGEKDQLKKQKEKQNEVQETLEGGRVAIVRHDGVHLIDVHQVVCCKPIQFENLEMNLDDECCSCFHRPP